MSGPDPDTSTRRETIVNTSMHGPGTFDAHPSAIEASEAAGAREIAAANGRRLPTNDSDQAWEFLLAHGATRGDVVDGDPIWTTSTLPDGWEVHGTDHPLWTEIHDREGFAVVAVNYKAAFYDRHCRMEVHATPMTVDQKQTLDELHDLICSTQDARHDQTGPRWRRRVKGRTVGEGRSVIDHWSLEITSGGLQPPIVIKTRQVEIDRDGVVISDVTVDHPDEF